MKPRSAFAHNLQFGKILLALSCSFVLHLQPGRNIKHLPFLYVNHDAGIILLE